MSSFFTSLHRIPSIKIGIQDEGLKNEEERVNNREDQKEMLDEPGGEIRVGPEQHEDKETTGQGGHTIQYDRNLDDFLG